MGPSWPTMGIYQYLRVFLAGVVGVCWRLLAFHGPRDGSLKSLRSQKVC